MSELSYHVGDVVHYADGKRAAIAHVGDGSVFLRFAADNFRRMSQCDFEAALRRAMRRGVPRESMAEAGRRVRAEQPRVSSEEAHAQARGVLAEMRKEAA